MNYKLLKNYTNNLASPLLRLSLDPPLQTLKSKLHLADLSKKCQSMTLSNRLVSKHNFVYDCRRRFDFLNNVFRPF